MVCKKSSWRFGISSLQWGRNMFVAEWRMGMSNDMYVNVVLQWGRNMFVAE